MKNNINLFSALQVQSKKQMDSGTKTFIIIIGACFLVTIIAILTSLFIKFSIDDKINTISTTLNSKEALDAIVLDKEIKTNIVITEKDILVASALNKKIKDSRGFELWMYSLIDSVKPANVVIKSISYTNMTISLTCESDKSNGDPPADYAKALEETDKFSRVTYSGFTELSEDNKVSFPITCVIKGDIQ